MADLQLTRLTNDDIPALFPTPLRMALLDQFENTNRLLEDLAAAIEKAEAAQSSSNNANESVSSLGSSTEKIANVAQSAYELSNNNSLKLLEIQDNTDSLDEVYVSKVDVNHQEIASSLGVSGYLFIDKLPVLYKRDGGWAQSVGTQRKGGMNSDAAYPVSDVPTQADVQAIANGLVETRQVLGAILEVLTNHHKLIGAS
jgi:hypothetical protein